MGKPLSLVAADGFKLGAYGADPAGKPKGGVVVIQEIFGVNHHIRSARRPGRSRGLYGARASFV
jgi:carboxymethylenebutenolidase